MILITGAAGKTGRSIVRALAAKQAKVRGLVRCQEQVEAVEGLGATEVVVGDLRSVDTLTQAMTGIEAVYHICPNMAPDEESIGRQVLHAARQAGVRLFAYHSVLHPQVESMPHHWHKMRVEEHIFQAGLPFVILQPAMYMQNILGQWQQIVDTGVFAVPYAVDCRLTMVDLEDVGQAAARVLTESGHQGAIYELCGPQVLSQTEVAEILGEVLGQPIRAEKSDLSAWKETVGRAGLGDYAIDTLLKMFQYYERSGFEGNSRVLGWILGRPPTSFSAFAHRVATEGRH